ncbi:MAG: S8 family serine peptidase [Ketobacter sp.]|nr:S8 family serine peptidase [Ketobacter sp.]
MEATTAKRQDCVASRMTLQALLRSVRRMGLCALLLLSAYSGPSVAVEVGWDGPNNDPFGLQPKERNIARIKEIPIALPGEFVVDLHRASDFDKTNTYIADQLGKDDYDIALIPNSTLSVVKFPVPKGGWINFNDYLAILEQAPGVADAQPNFVRYTTVGQSPFSDPQANKQWFLQAINAERAWQINQDASSVVVAVIDDAIMVQHEDLQGNLWNNPGEIPGNGIDDDRNGYVDDVHGWNFGANNNDPSPRGSGCIESGHGTHVAGAIGAVGGNGKGVTGVSPKVKIMALSAGRPDSRCGFDSAGILEAVRYAVDNGAKVINLSLGGPMGTRIAKQTYQYASDRNVLLVVAAGNDGLSNDVEDIPQGSEITLTALVRDNKVVHQALAPSYPAAFSRSIDGMLTVANMRADTQNSANLFLYRRDIPWDYVGVGVKVQGGKLVTKGFKKLSSGSWVVGSSYGARTVQIGTPGTDIFSTIPKPSGAGAASGYGMMTGTSMASPITAGAAALLWSSFPELSNVQIKQRLLASVKKNSDLNGKVGSAGQLDIYEALCGKQFSKRATGCDGNKPRTKPPQAAPPVSKPVPEPKPKPAPTPETKPTPAPEPKPKPTANDWLRGAEDSSEGSIEW